MIVSLLGEESGAFPNGLRCVQIKRRRAIIRACAPAWRLLIKNVRRKA